MISQTTNRISREEWLNEQKLVERLDASLALAREIIAMIDGVRKEARLVTPGSDRGALPMKYPTVNLNGTSKAALLEQQINALNAVNDAIEALQEACPNGRDYTPQGSPQALSDLNQALSEHRVRIMRLTDIGTELEQIALHISEQGR